MTMAYAQAVRALWWRDVRKLVRQRARLLSGLAQPLMYLLALGAGLNSVFASAGYGDYTHFLSPGVVAMAVMTSSFVSGISVLWDRKFGFLKESLVAPVPRWTIVMGRALGAATTASLQGGIVVLVSVALGNRLAGSAPSALAALLGGMFITGVVFALAGIWCGAIIEDFQAVQLIVNFVLMPLFFLSGALFPVKTASGALAEAVKLNPVTYAVDLLRAAFTGQAQWGIARDLGVIACCIGLGFVLATYALSRVRVG